MMVEIESNLESLEMYSDTYPFRLPLRINSFENEAEYKKFIKNIEKILRGSVEYKQWRDYIKDVLQVNSCVLTNENMEECVIDIHHHVPSLFLMIKAIINKKIEDEEEFSTFDIALETIELHFKNKVGYVALLRDMHGKFHNGYISIPIEHVKGDYNYFIENYQSYLDEDDVELLNHRLAIHLADVPEPEWSRDNYPGMLSVEA